MDAEQIREYRERFFKIADEILADYENYEQKCKAAGRKPYQPDYVPTLRRIKEDPDRYFRFLEDFEVPYTNNLAERGCRKIKGKKKVSGQFITLETADAYAMELTVIENAKLNGKNPIMEIRNIIA